MKLLSIEAQGLPLFKDGLCINFFAQQRVNENDKENLFQLSQTANIYLHTASAFIGLNAAGKTSVLKVIILALGILNNEAINHMDAKAILMKSPKTVIRIYFCDREEKICCLETEIGARRTKAGGYTYFIINEKLWEKPISSIKSKRQITSFDNMEPSSTRDTNELFLPDDVSFIIARNKKTNGTFEAVSLLSYTNVNVLPAPSEIPLEIIAYLDPTIEKLYFEQNDDKTLIHLKFKGEDEITINDNKNLEQYLSSGTIKGIITFSMAKDILQSGGYLIVDEIENHFNKEIVATLIRFFKDSRLNKNGGMLIFSTHYPELLDEYDRNDGIHIVSNQQGITVENLSKLLKRNDIKKSEAYQSGILTNTAPAYESYIQLRRNFKEAIG